MKKNMFVSVMTVMVICSSILSCKKGDSGTPGPAGSANVIYSDWFTPATYTKDTIFGIWGLNYNKAATSITQQALDSGTVLTFGKLSGYNSVIWPAGQVAQLPITLTYILGSTVTDTWSALATVGNLRIRFVNDHNIYNSISNAHSFRYIIIPGGKSGGRMMPQSYSEICKQYNIPE